jgi:hypothetical protein
VPRSGADADGDGVADASDQCADTPAGDLVGDTGCSVCPCDGGVSDRRGREARGPEAREERDLRPSRPHALLPADRVLLGRERARVRGARRRRPRHGQLPSVALRLGRRLVSEHYKPGDLAAQALVAWQLSIART